MCVELFCFVSVVNVELVGVVENVGVEGVVVVFFGMGVVLLVGVDWVIVGCCGCGVGCCFVLKMKVVNVVMRNVMLMSVFFLFIIERE